jgi:hypothetical protein
MPQTTLAVNGVGGDNAWAASGGTKVDCVTTSDAGATFISTVSSGAIQTYELENLPSSAFRASNMRFRLDARYTSNPTQDHTFQQRHHVGADITNTSQALTTSFATYNFDHPNEPAAGSSGWRAASVNSLNCGCRIIAGSGAAEAQVTFINAIATWERRRGSGCDDIFELLGPVIGPLTVLALRDVFKLTMAMARLPLGRRPTVWTPEETYELFEELRGERWPVHFLWPGRPLAVVP